MAQEEPVGCRLRCTKPFRDRMEQLRSDPSTFASRFIPLALDFYFSYLFSHLYHEAILMVSASEACCQNGSGKHAKKLAW